MTLTQERITEQLDRLEASLPTIPSKTVAFGRAAARRTTDTANTLIGEVTARTDTIGRSVTTATRTAVGQARSVADRSFATVRDGVAEATGQARAQAGIVVETIEDETAGLLDAGAAAVDPASIRPASLADLNKEELYERARSADVAGRSSMSKDELIGALRT